MILEPNNLYHVYNQGNNREAIFTTRDDYISFLKYARLFVLPYADVLCYCLMPNHFHMLISTTEESVRVKRIGNIESTYIQNGFRILQSSYTRLHNNRTNRSGSLFRQRTKFKKIKDDQNSYVCFNYIHQNPKVAGLCEKIEDWEFSSFPDFIGIRNGTFCKLHIAKELIQLYSDTFYEDSYQTIPDFKMTEFY